jgi:hypothetical protein
MMCRAYDSACIEHNNISETQFISFVYRIPPCMLSIPILFQYSPPDYCSTKEAGEEDNTAST